MEIKSERKVCPYCNNSHFLEYGETYSEPYPCVFCGKSFSLLKKLEDPISSPSHYTQGKIEPKDFILANDLRKYEGDIVKYAVRWRYKGDTLKEKIQDLEKIIECANILKKWAEEGGLGEKM